MRRFVCLALVAVAAGCGGGGDQNGDEASGPGPGETLATYADAVVAFDMYRMRRVLSSRLDDEEVEAVMDTEHQRMQAFAGWDEPKSFLDDKSSILFERQLDDRVAVGVLAGETIGGAYAAPLVREKGAWRVVPRSQFFIAEGRPHPDSTTGPRPPQLDATITAIVAGGKEPEVRLWLDDEELEAELTGAAGVYRVRAAEIPELEPGRHLVTVFARAGNEVGSTAWRFTVR